MLNAETSSEKALEALTTAFLRALAYVARLCARHLGSLVCWSIMLFNKWVVVTMSAEFSFPFVPRARAMQLKAKITSATSAVKSMFGQGEGAGDKAVEWRSHGTPPGTVDPQVGGGGSAACSWHAPGMQQNRHAPGMLLACSWHARARWPQPPTGLNCSSTCHSTVCQRTVL